MMDDQHRLQLHLALQHQDVESRVQGLLESSVRKL